MQSTEDTNKLKKVITQLCHALKEEKAARQALLVEQQQATRQECV